MSDLTPKTIFAEKIPGNLKADPGKTAGLNAIYQFNITGDDGGSWYVDLTKSPAEVSEGKAEKANCTITCSSADFVGIVTGKLNGQMAFMTGKLKIAGDMGLAMKLQKVLG